MQKLQTKFKNQTNLTEKDIQQLLDNGMRQIDVAMLFNVSQSTISRLAAKPKIYTKTTTNDVEFCSCCRKRPIAKGNRFLCGGCYRGEMHDDQCSVSKISY